MLFVLTGDIQTGKTRWLESLIGELEDNDITSYGVIAPGVWKDHRDTDEPSEFIDANGFEKLGIDNVLLPERKRIAFARRQDLAMQEGTYDETRQSSKANLLWDIDDGAINRVNEHFDELVSQSSRIERPSSGLLVVDELGRLELLRGEGLTAAMNALELGPNTMYQHALVIVRESLVDMLDGRFGKWASRRSVYPNDAGKALVFKAFEAQ